MAKGMAGGVGSGMIARGQVPGRAIIAGLAAALFSAPAPAANAAEPFASLMGAWRGQAKVVLASGSSETLKCNAYYTPKSGGAELGLAIRCASASNRIELRAQLAHASGGISGQWEERTYNAAGAVTGYLAGSALRLSIQGSAFKASMAVQTTGNQQSVSIQTNGLAMTGINISLQRS